MVVGIALLGVVTGTFAIWLIEQVATTEEETADLRSQIATLSAKIDQLVSHNRDVDASKRRRVTAVTPRVL